MFDRFLLPPARLEFVIMTDTHYMLDPGKQAVEFENRRLQSARAAVALAQVAALGTPFVVHLGDLVQTFPGRADFAAAVDEAQAQINSFGLDMRLAPGNHDVGDKPDPTMPAEWATPAALDAHHARFGRSWFSWDWEDLHFVVLNSQIMNTPLPQAQEQAAWAEADLTAHVGKRQFLFLHMPPYLYTPQEPSLGHYDNLAQPARGWLLDLARRSGVELMCAAHVHWAYYDWILHAGSQNDDPQSGKPQSGKSQSGDTHLSGEQATDRGIRYYVTPSPAFTRPGFSELFSSPPPDQQGRNDTPKLGFYLARVQEDGTRLHFLRTGGATESPPVQGQRLLTRHPRDLPASGLGVYLRHPLANVDDVPVAWPSVIRQRVRNDYPLLLAQEMGVRRLRFPVEELADPFQRGRLALARQEGIDLIATVLWPPDQDREPIAEWARALLDGVEIQMPAATEPDATCAAWAQAVDAAGVAVTFAPLQPHYTVAGKQHDRTQLGYRLEELIQSAPRLAGLGLQHARGLCVARSVEELWRGVAHLAQEGLPQGLAGVDWLIPAIESRSDQGDLQQTAWAAQALFVVAGLPGTRVFFDPWMDLDRTMDSLHGLIDRRCNPRLAFHAVKHLNSLLFAEPSPLRLQGRETTDAGEMLTAEREGRPLALLIPRIGEDGVFAPWTLALDDLSDAWGAGELRCYDLCDGLARTFPSGDRTLEIVAPSLLVG